MAGDVPQLWDGVPLTAMHDLYFAWLSLHNCIWLQIKNSTQQPALHNRIYQDEESKQLPRASDQTVHLVLQSDTRTHNRKHIHYGMCTGTCSSSTGYSYEWSSQEWSIHGHSYKQTLLKFRRHLNLGKNCAIRWISCGSLPRYRWQFQQQR